MNTIIDTDALLGIAYAQDAHYAQATTLLTLFVQKKAEIIILPTTMCEFSLLATSRIGMVKTKEVTQTLMSGNYTILPITDQLVRQAFDLYREQTSKEESLFDCYNMVIARMFHADCIFSFDRGYTKNGLVLAEDFFKKCGSHP